MDVFMLAFIMNSLKLSVGKCLGVHMCFCFCHEEVPNVLQPQQSNVLKVVGFQTRPIRQHCNMVMRMVGVCSAEHPWAFFAGKRKNVGAVRRK